MICFGFKFHFYVALCVILNHIFIISYFKSHVNKKVIKNHIYYVLQKGVLYMSIGEKLRQLRSDKNLTQKNLADILHITRTTYVKYETDSIKLSFEKASKLADFFNITTDYLLENKHETVPTLETGLPPIDLINVLDHTEIVFDGITYKLNNSSRKKIIDSLKGVFLSIQKQNAAQ